MSSVITRFAPSPSGFLHIGSVRTALINYLFVKKSKKEFKDSKFLLRIEDTDKERSENKYFESIINGLKWLNINWEEEIYIQSKNINLHKNIAEDLLNNKKAFKCICTKEQLDKKREKYVKERKNIKRLCTTCENNIDIQSLKKDYCVRMSIPNNGSIVIDDLVQGKVEVLNSEIDNFIILRRDSTPTYMLSVVVDDNKMGITHIIRGDDHLNNAFKQFHIYNSLNWKIPKFVHIPLMHGNDGSKLSKRHGSMDIIEFKNNGYLANSIVNYLLTLGIYSSKNEIFSIDSIIKDFELSKINKSPSKFDYEKLNFINLNYIKNLNNNDVINLFKNDYNFDATNFDTNLITKALDILKNRSNTLLNLKDNILPFLIAKNLKRNKNDVSEESIILLKKYKDIIDKENEWEKEKIERITKEFTNNENIKFNEIGEPIRLILTGKSKGIPISDILIILGKKETLERINNFFI